MYCLHTKFFLSGLLEDARHAMAALPTFAGLSTPQLVARRQDEVNLAHEKAMASASVRALTLRTALREMRDVMVTMPREWHAKPVSVQALLTRNRLRGLGVLCIMLTLVGLLVV
jgi:hypothetical protein